MVKQFQETALEEKQVSSKSVYRGCLLDIYDDVVSLPNGATSHREYNKHLGAVCIVPVTDDGKVIVERQYRYATGQVMLEIPAGKLDAIDEDPLEAGKRELREETGALAENWTYMGAFYPAPAYSNEKIHMYLATGLSFGDRDLDEDEFLNVELMPIDVLVEQIMAGNVPDIKTQASVLRAQKMLG